MRSRSFSQCWVLVLHVARVGVRPSVCASGRDGAGDAFGLVCVERRVLFLLYSTFVVLSLGWCARSRLRAGRARAFLGVTSARHTQHVHTVHTERNCGPMLRRRWWASSHRQQHAKPYKRRAHAAYAARAAHAVPFLTVSHIRLKNGI